MVQEQQKPTAQARGLPEDTALPEDGRPVVVDPLSRELAVLVECVDPAERKFQMPAGCGEIAPGSAVRAANQALDDDRIAAHVFLTDCDLQVRKSPEQLFVEGPDPIQPDVVLVPWLVVVPRR